MVAACMEGCWFNLGSSSSSRLVLLLCGLLLASLATVQAVQPMFPAFFVFGDSLVDVGNNNYILTLAKANSKPFGIDFPAGPTGRFTNGKTTVDVICELLQLPFAPPYLAPGTRGEAILKGVNYASAAGGILPLTGLNYIGRVDFDTQLQWFGNTATALQQQLGVSATKDLMQQSLYVAVWGSNDFINNYLLAAFPTSKQKTPSQYQEQVLSKYGLQLTQLYKMGARTVVVVGVGPLGCIPAQLVAQKSVAGKCSDYVNNLVLNFNAGLKILLQQLNAQLPDSKFIYADTYTPVYAIYSNPAAYGFQFNSQACCGLGKYGGQGPCLSFGKFCSDRDKYIFFDPFHPTQAANYLLGKKIFQDVQNSLGNFTA